MLQNWLAEWKRVGRSFRTKKQATNRKPFAVNKVPNQDGI